MTSLTRKGEWKLDLLIDGRDIKKINVLCPVDSKIFVNDKKRTDPTLADLVNPSQIFYCKQEEEMFEGKYDFYCRNKRNG